MSEYEDGLNVACWDWRRTWVKIILSFVPLGLLFVCLTDVRPLCVCKERLLRQALWSASLLISAYLCGLSPALTDARAGAAAPLLHTQIGQSSIVRGPAEESKLHSLLSHCDKFGRVLGGRGEIGVKHWGCVLFWQLVTLPHRCLSKREGSGSGQEGLRALRCGCVLSQVHISVILLGKVRIKVVARKNLENHSFALFHLNGIAVHCSKFHWLDQPWNHCMQDFHLAVNGLVSHM